MKRAIRLQIESPEPSSPRLAWTVATACWILTIMAVAPSLLAQREQDEPDRRREAPREAPVEQPQKWQAEIAEQLENSLREVNAQLKRAQNEAERQRFGQLRDQLVRRLAEFTREGQAAVREQVLAHADVLPLLEDKLEQLRRQRNALTRLIQNAELAEEAVDGLRTNLQAVDRELEALAADLKQHREIHSTDRRPTRRGDDEPITGTRRDDDHSDENHGTDDQVERPAATDHLETVSGKQVMEQLGRELRRVERALQHAEPDNPQRQQLLEMRGQLRGQLERLSRQLFGEIPSAEHIVEQPARGHADQDHADQDHADQDHADHGHADHHHDDHDHGDHDHADHEHVHSDSGHATQERAAGQARSAAARAISETREIDRELRRLEVELGHGELVARSQEAAMRTAEIALHEEASAAAAIRMASDLMEPDEAREFLQQLLIETDDLAVRRLLHMELARVCSQQQDREAVKAHLRHVILNR